MSSPDSRVLVTIQKGQGEQSEVVQFNPNQICGAIKQALKVFGDGLLCSENGSTLTDSELVCAGRYTFQVVAAGGAGEGAGTAAGLETIVEQLQHLQQDLQGLKLSMPIKLSRDEALKAFGAVFVFFDNTEGRQGKTARLTRQAVEALNASSSGGNADPVYWGSGFFYKRRDLAVTPWHQVLDDEGNVQNNFQVYLPQSQKIKHLEFVSGDAALDMAYLRCTDSDDDQTFLEPDVTFAKEDGGGTSVVLVTTLINVSRQFGKKPTFGQFAANITGVLDSNFTYSASTFEGDCGCPILLRHGKVVGMHVEMVNAHKSGSEQGSKRSRDQIQASLASSGPHLAVGVFACDFPREPDF